MTSFVPRPDSSPPRGSPWLPLLTSSRSPSPPLGARRPARPSAPFSLPPPAAGLRWDPAERQILDQFLTCSAVGSPQTVEGWLKDFAARTRADELIVASQIHDHPARLRSYEIAADALGLAPAPAQASVPA